MSAGSGKPYTVWSDGELVGESQLDYLANTSQAKFGDFAATEYGERIIAIRMAPRRALCVRAPWKEIEALQACRDSAVIELRGPDGRIVPTDDIEITDLEWLTSLTSSAGWEEDLQCSEYELIESLQPQPPIRDDVTELLTGWPTGEEELIDYEFTADSELRGTPEFPRYQIQVRITRGG